MNPHCVLLVSLGKLVKVEAQDPALLQQSPRLAQPSQFFHLGATQLSPRPPESTPLGRGREAVMSRQALTAITAQVHSTSVLSSHSAQVQLQPGVSFVGAREVSQERKGREKLTGVRKSYFMSKAVSY